MIVEHSELGVEFLTELDGFTRFSSDEDRRAGMRERGFEFPRDVRPVLNDDDESFEWWRRNGHMVGVNCGGRLSDCLS